MKDENIHIPIIIGNSAPFRLVLRETDKWEPSIEEINNLKYDYVLLHRLSSFIDIGIAPFSMAIGFDGSLILPALPEYKSREAAADTLNRTLGIMLLGGVYSESVSPIDISYGRLFVKGYYSISGGGSGHNANFHRDIQNKYVGKLDSIKLMNPPVVLESDLQSAYKKGSEIYSKLGSLSAGLFLNGVSHFVKHQWVEALVSIWTSIEQLINLIWQNEIVRKAANSEQKITGRTNFLKDDHRTWTVAARIEMLFQNNYFKIEEYQLLNGIRKSRNEFIHKGIVPNESVLQNTMEVAFRIMSLIITKYSHTNSLDYARDNILKNQRGELYPKKTKFEKDEVKFWMNIPPIPGDDSWKGKYEIIDELVLKPLKK